jgi:hypothetical protein
LYADPALKLYHPIQIREDPKERIEKKTKEFEQGNPFNSEE